MGNYTFIYENNQIEEKVIEALVRIRLDYLLVLEAKLLDKNGQEVQKKDECPHPLCPGQFFEFSTLIEKAEYAESYSVKIFDPNTKLTKNYQQKLHS
jgi:hypothetical protein